MTSNEPLSTNTIPRPRILVYLTHTVLFLLATSAGAALIFSLQTPKPPPGTLHYEIHFLTFNKPVDDLTSELPAIHKTPPGRSSWNGADLVGNHQFSTQPEERLRFTMATPSFYAEYRNLSPLRFEVQGVPHGDRIRTNLTIGVNKVDFSHHFELAESEYRVVQFIYGEKQHRRWCYAIVRVQSAKPSPSVGAALSGPKNATYTED